MVFPQELQEPLLDVSLKLSIVGDAAVGKTSLLKTFLNKKPTVENFGSLTVLENFKSEIELEKSRRVFLEFWDMGGTVEFESIRKLTYVGSDAIMICYSCVSEISLNNIRDYWLPEIRDSCDSKIPFVLVGTKLDLIKYEKDHITSKHAAAFARSIKAHSQIQCSTLEYDTDRVKSNVDEAFKKLISCGLQSVMKSKNFTVLL